MPPFAVFVALSTSLPGLRPLLVGGAIAAGPGAASAERPASPDGAPADSDPAGPATVVGPAPEVTESSCPSVDDLDAAAREVRAEDAIQRAVQAFAAGNDAEALAAIDTADCYAPRPAHDYMRGAILQEAGRCEEAIAHFDAFVAQDVPPSDADDARRKREECEAIVAETVPPAADPESVTTPQVTPDVMPPRDPGGGSCPTPSGRDGLMIGLFAGGGLVLGAGVGMVVGAQALHGADRDALSDHDRAVGTARRLNAVGWAALGTGAALVAGGAIRAVVVKRKRRREYERLPAECLRAPYLPLGYE